MSDSQNPGANPSNPGQDDMASALFAQLVMQQANMAMMLLGRVPHPQSGEVVKDVEAARFFIDQLEMLETKTKGNLTGEEDHFLRQSLMNLRLAFVEAVGSGDTKPRPEPAPAAQTPESPKPGSTTGAPPPSAAPEEESHKKFTKKY
jgi:hypothetical protein